MAQKHWRDNRPAAILPIKRTMRMNLSAKLFLEDQEKYVLGPGRVELLRSVKELGSLRKAAQKLGMSYRWAWGRLNDAEKALGVRLLAHNEASGGKAKTLTAEALELLAWYDSIDSDVKAVLESAVAGQPKFLKKNYTARKKGENGGKAD